MPTIFATTESNSPSQNCGQSPPVNPNALPTRIAEMTEPVSTNLFSLKGKIIVVSGAGRGMGLCQTEALIDHGATVYALDRLEHPSDDFARVQHKAEKLGSTLKYVHVDVTDEAGLKKAISTIADAHHGIHGLIAAAGVQHELPALQFTAQQVNALLAINVTGVYTTTQAVAEAMIKYKIKGGSIALIASMSGTVANRNLLSAPYNISKAGVQQAGRSFAAELGSHGIRVNTISPGYVETEMVLGLFKTHPERRTSWASQNCLGRIGKPEDLQGVAVYLMSDASRWQTGSDVRVDGGHTAW